MKNRLNISSGSPWEEKAGYCRAVRIGNIVEVAGTTAVENGKLVGLGDAAKQAFCIFQKIELALKEAGASMQDVVRTRMYLTNIEDWETVCAVHAQFFKDIKPVATLVEVSGLIDPEMLVEIEVSAVIADS